MNQSKVATIPSTKTFWTWFAIVVVAAAVIIVVIVVAVIYTKKSSSNSSYSSSNSSSGSRVPTAQSQSQGSAVAISGDGTTIAVGAPQNDGAIGETFIFIYNDKNWTQQAVLQGTVTIGSPQEGYCLALSENGDTVAIGAPYNNGDYGTVWIFNRNAGIWSQKFMVPAPSNQIQQGSSVSLSNDGTVLAFGAPNYQSTGAVLVYNLVSGTWTSTTTLVGTGSVGTSYQGSAVTMSGDGTVIATGGYSDNTLNGAVWVFKYSGVSWSQQGTKLQLSSPVTGFGVAVSLNSNGTTLAVSCSNALTYGCFTVWTYSSSTWTQQGSIYRPNDITTAAVQGLSLALSADGNTLAYGNSGDTSNNGAFWVFLRVNGTWIQSGNKKIGTLNIGPSKQGYSISISNDGNTIVEGGPNDNTTTNGNVGSAWVFQ